MCRMSVVSIKNAWPRLQRSTTLNINHFSSDFWTCDYLFMPELKLIHVSKRGHWYHLSGEGYMTYETRQNVLIITYHFPRKFNQIHTLQGICGNHCCTCQHPISNETNSNRPPINEADLLMKACGIHLGVFCFSNIPNRYTTSMTNLI